MNSFYLSSFVLNTPPAAPMGLSATGGAGQVSLSWTGSIGASSYSVYRSTTSGGPYTAIASDLAGTTYTDTGVTNGTTYYYVVTASNLFGESASSNQASATPSAPPADFSLSASPSSLSVAPGSNGQSTITISPTNGFCGSMSLSASGQPAGVTAGFSPNPATSTSTLTLTVASASPGDYPLSIQGTSGSLSHTTPLSLTVTAAPALTLSASAGDSQVSLSWTDTSGAVSYDVKRSTTSGGPYTTIASNQTGTTYTDTGLTNGTTYFYIVSGVNGSGQEYINSNEASATPQAGAGVSLSSITLAQFAMKAGDTGIGAVTLNGIASSTIIVNLSSDDPATAVPASVSVAAGQTSATFNITSNTVEKTTVNVTASYNGVTKIVQLDAYPGIDLTVIATGTNKITLYWTGVSGSIGYNLYRGTSVTGPFTRINSTPISPVDNGPGLTDRFIYSDTGLTSGTEYFYYVASVLSEGTEGLQSNGDSAIPDASAISWDTADAALIVSQVRSMVNANLAGDETDAGLLTISGPDGVIYQSYSDGSAQAFASPGHIDSNKHTLVYADGNEVPAPNDPPTALENNTQDVVSNASIATSFLSPNSCPQQQQYLNMTYTIPNIRYAGIFREVDTQPGYPSVMAYVGLPSALDLPSSNVDGRPFGTSIFPTSDTGYTYFGGTAYQTITNRMTGKITLNYPSQLDAGLMLFRTADTSRPGWIPIATPNPGTTFTGEFTGYPLESDAAAANQGANTGPQIYVYGNPLMAFKAPGYGTIPDRVIVLSFHSLGNGNVITYDQHTHVSTEQGDATFVKAGERGWTRRACISIKRMNTIAQKFSVSATPPYTATPTPDGPGGFFKKTGSFVLGMDWGDLVDPFATVDGVMLFPGGQWTNDPTITWREGSYPAPNTPSPGNPYVGYLSNRQFL